MHHEMAQREVVWPQGTFAALRAIATRERRVARGAPFDAGSRRVDARGHHGWPDSMTKGLGTSLGAVDAYDAQGRAAHLNGGPMKRMISGLIGVLLLAPAWQTTTNAQTPAPATKP